MRHLPRPIQYFLITLLLIMACFPLYGEILIGNSQGFWMEQLTHIMILAIVALSLDLLVGVTGMVSLAQAAFFGLAGYTLVLYAPEFEAVSIWVGLPVVLIVSAAVALVMGLLIVRTSGIFFIMVTIAFSQMFYYFFHDSSFAGGSDGLYLLMKPDVSIAGYQLLDLDNPRTVFYVALMSLVLIYLLLRTFMRAPFGRVLLGIKENEHRVQAMGFKPLYYKLTVFIIAGMISGYAGLLSVVQYGFVSPGQVSWLMSAHVLVMVIIGGIGSLFGAILGAFAFEGLHTLFSNLTKHWELPMGLVVIAIVVMLPKGIAGLLLDMGARFEKSSKEEDKPVALPLKRAAK
ncbi:branched-chain amino acid ABC transporter permease [Halopseudomonas pelagia]|uniref:branched-chain amino acid ABC transporter permease n=1 Tax=Halopseudomonas pelagia TaxID=553151 RepID=UPI0030DAFB5D